MDEELKVPYVSKELLQYLERMFSLDSIVMKKMSNNDEHMGYLKGTRDIISNLKHIQDNQ